MIIKFTSAQNYQITNIDGGKAEKQIAMSRSMTRQSHQLLPKFIQPMSLRFMTHKLWAKYPWSEIHAPLRKLFMVKMLDFLSRLHANYIFRSRLKTQVVTGPDIFEIQLPGLPVRKRKHQEVIRPGLRKI